jgi:hypothetical protein
MVNRVEIDESVVGEKENSKVRRSCDTKIKKSGVAHELTDDG